MEYTYTYLNGMLVYETRGEAKFYYSYDSNGILYSVKYTLTDDSELLTYYYTHNSRGDIIGIYNGSGDLKAHYEYDAWGNILSITDADGNAITSATHVGNLNPFRYRGYYYDSETGLYYLMSRYYDPVTHRFLNADGYFQSGGDILDLNMSAYCRNNPIMFVDPTGTHACGDPTCTICRADRRDFINDRTEWYNNITGNNVLKVLDDGTFVYMVTDTQSNTKSNTNYKSNSIFIIDKRTEDDPNIQIVDSVAINQCYQYTIIELIQEYNIKNPVTNSKGVSWDRTTSDLMSEWNAHNFLFIHSYITKYFFDNVEKRTQSVDFNNADQGKFAWF